MDIEDILKQHNLNNTPCRRYIIEKLYESHSALSDLELKSLYTEEYDRVTFYRSIKLLEEKQIIHRIVLPDATVKYAFNKDLELTHNHAHFHCTDCGKVVCLESREETKITLPEGFLVKSKQVLLEGVCPKCEVE